MTCYAHGIVVKLDSALSRQAPIDLWGGFFEGKVGEGGTRAFTLATLRLRASAKPLRPRALIQGCCACNDRCAPAPYEYLRALLARGKHMRCGRAATKQRNAGHVKRADVSVIIRRLILAIAKQRCRVFNANDVVRHPPCGERLNAILESAYR